MIMAITRRPPAAAKKATVDQAAAERFIKGAPDAAPAQAAQPAAAASTIVKGHQVQISFALPPELLIKVDAAADSLSISRAAFIKQALSRAVVAESN